jgi:hypothetical protein
MTRRATSARPYETVQYKVSLAHPLFNGAAIEVGQCRLTVSKPELKARLISALETEMW